MSHIAAALAKSKGKAVQPGDQADVTAQIASGVSRPPMRITGAPVAPARPKALLFAGGGLAVAILGGAIWFLFLRAAPSPAAPPTLAAAPAPTPAPAAAVVKPKTEAAALKASSAGAQSKPPTAPAVVAAAPEPAGPSDEIFTSVRKFALSAVKAGADGRAMINGKTYHAGDEVAPGVVLREIKEGLLIFTDEAGNTYPRRF